MKSLLQEALLPGPKLFDLKCQCKQDGDYTIIYPTPAVGVLYVTKSSPNFISGHIRLLGRKNGAYPYKYLDMIDSIFGEKRRTIEVCSGSVKSERGCYTVDINRRTRPDHVGNGETLTKIADNSFDRWRCDPPYSATTAKAMYGTALPNIMKLLKAGARVCKPGALMFLLLGAKNHQWCPPGVKRIGWIAITIVPCCEIRCLNIFVNLTHKASIGLRDRRFN